MNFFSSHKKIGILGGGQLGKMFLNTTRKWDITTHVLDPNENAPSKFSCNHFQCGDFNDYETAYKFGKNLDVITYEIEHVNVDALYALKDEGVIVYPSPENLSIIQDKFSQKKFYENHHIPTVNYKFYASKNTLESALKNKKLNYPFVWKSTKMGYDGYGVKIIKNIEDLKNVNNVPCISEDLIKYSHELAVIVCRNSDGEIKTYPIIEMEFNEDSHQVEYVTCPAQISFEASSKAKEIALLVSKSFNHIGLLAVELFLTYENEILVNEVAPRPHNSGHFSIEGSATDQFEQHLRAILNMPLGETTMISPSVMLNLVGAKGYNGNVTYNNIEKILALPGVNLHIYGKKKTRPDRKMGHVTILNKEIKEAKKIAKTIKKIITIISK